MAPSGRRTVRERAAESWADAESAVTKALLLGVFCLGLVAQFVRPVGDALEGKAYLGGALLTLVGYVLYAEVRRLNDALRPQARDEIRTEDLRQYFGRALVAGRPERIRIDAIGYTGETVVRPVLRVLEDFGGGGNARPVVIRILVPDFTASMAIPGRLDGDGKAVDDPDFRATLLAKAQGFAGALDELARNLAGRRAVDARFRALHITPFLKFCLINDEELFDGIYDEVVRKPARTPTERQVLDLMGYQASLTRWHVRSGAEAREKVARRRELFDTLWELASALPEPPPAHA
ncbi:MULTISPECIES: hypothetical protein [unclassified Streptomyces]|uniref:hypothetical protein n=1 Tax=unclassified Streptomyces TaxID=2593676 RepID=UPI001CBCE470|nr:MULTISPECIES: hypothetical protein [unclassified Streptomyces]WPO72892.1 hypothetical protein R9806_20785 [Streptomyces sp. KN37]